MRAGNTGAVTLRRPLTPAQFGDLADLPPELEWLANLTNHKTRRAYKIDVEEFIAFAGLGGIAELRAATRAMSSPGARTWRSVNLPTPASAASSRRSPPCSIISASTTPSSAIRSTGQAPHGQWAMRQHAGLRRCAGAPAAGGATWPYSSIKVGYAQSGAWQNCHGKMIVPPPNYFEQLSHAIASLKYFCQVPHLGTKRGTTTVMDNKARRVVDSQFHTVCIIDENHMSPE